MKTASILFVLLFATFLLLLEGPEISFDNSAPQPDTIHAPAAEAPPGPIPGCVEPPPGLRAWWPLDEDRGDPIVTDRAGVLNHGWYEGDLLPEVDTSGMVASSRIFNGVDQYIQVENHAELNFGTGDFSIDFWIKLPSPVVQGIVPIIDKRTFGPVRGYFVHTFDGQLRLQLADGGDESGPDVCGNDPLANPCTIYTSDLDIDQEKWLFATVSVDRDDAVRFSLFDPADGTTQTSISPGDVTLRDGSLDNQAPLFIARHADNEDIETDVPSFFNGSLDEIEIYGRALDDQDFATLVVRPSTGKCKWPLDWTSGVPQTMGLESLTNLDAVNACGGPTASGFRFLIYDLDLPASPTNYSFPNTFETPCPADDCNPFSPPQVVPDYQSNPDQIVLQWPAAGQSGGTPVPSGQKRHFGYTMHHAQPGVPEHKVVVEWLINEPGSPCAFDYGVAWTVEPLLLYIGWGGLSLTENPEPARAMQQGPVRVDFDSLRAWLTLDLDGEAEVDLRTHVSTGSIALNDLVSSNPIVMTSTLVAEGIPLQSGIPISATLKASGEPWPVELSESSHAVVIADVYRLSDGAPRQLIYRLLHAAPIEQLRALLPRSIYLPAAYRTHP